ncbi:ejaculatory bulb-specific protein 3-like [Achroia grisella]|uniref:ejaculatory bulb-specific protein 3-like n=1 Tax=Achroia grisella TaxID=688607 RepID=UPI0027D24ED2|nr:ejaculatory bulb-specific protein 3-like [Achroia grisella]
MNNFKLTMKTVISLCVLVAAVCYAQDTYNPQFDSFNAEEVADNTRLLKNYGKCFLDQGPCTAEGSDFKRVIPEALRTSCAKCTPKQRVLIRTVVRAFQTKLPDIWEALIQKHDPEGTYKASFDNFLNAQD